MSGRRAPAKRGRPPTVLIADPAEARERGERAALIAQIRYERACRRPGRWKQDPPVQPTRDLDRGLVYARYAGLVAPTAVRHIIDRASEFRDWIANQRGARGPRIRSLA